MDALRYYLATMVVGVAMLGLWLGGGWVWLGIGTFPVLMALDLILPSDHGIRTVHTRTGRIVANVPAFVHVPLMVGLWALFLLQLGRWASGDSTLSILNLVGMILSVGWVGAVPGLPVAHELMHRRHWAPRALAKIGGTFYLDPNRDVGHKLTHHIDLCTPADSDTPSRGQNIYTFMWQASYGSWKDGAMTSVMALRKRDLSIFHPKNAVYVELGLIGLLAAATALVAGAPGLVAAAGAMLFAKLLVEGFNYLQHYGMVRVPGAPIRIHHAWNHLGAIIRPVGLEITNHIDHHFDSKHQFYELKPRIDGAQMPSAFLCFATALVPPVWERYIAKPRLKHWDTHFASPAEQAMAMAQNREAGWPIWVTLAKGADSAVSSAS
ncbi:MAG TPA: xylene monooxygenase [Pseudonocardia sp.]|nr:xylene monooxygenase [Pseudonocardia sp.]